MARGIRNFLKNPVLRGIAINEAEILGLHKEILRSKPLLRSAYEEFYETVNREFRVLEKLEGKIVELGSGAGFAKELIPDVITTDVREGESIDMYLDATQMPFEADSLKGIFAINVFHHLNDPESFFSEISRTMAKGGVCIIIEPHKGFLSKFVHSRIHTDEFFDMNQQDWKNKAISGPLSGANQALSDIVFRRDQEKFNTLFGSKLNLSHGGYVKNQFRFLLSGGVNYRQIIPSRFVNILKRMELISSPFVKQVSLHQIWILRKN